MRLILSICLLICTLSLSAQETQGELVTIEQNNGQLFVGSLVKISADKIEINLDGIGNKSFPKKDIKKLHKGIFNNDQITNTAEPYYLPTARTNGRGNHYYKNYFLFGNNFDFGVSDYVSLSFGFELASVLLDNSNDLPIMQVGTKVQIPVSDQFNLAFFSRFAFNNEGSILIVGAPITVGGKRTNFTLTPNFLKNSDDDELYANVSFAGSLSLTDNVRLVSDMVLLNEILINTTFVEITFKNGFSILPGIIVSNDFSIVPNFALTVPFGNWK